METRIVKEEISRDELYILARRSIKTPVSKHRWFTLSLFEQLGNIGSEVGRAAKWQSKDNASFWGATTRALELFDLTREDPRWRRQRPEIDRARESFADAVLGGKEYQSTLPDLERYFMQFALLAREAS